MNATIAPVLPSTVSAAPVSRSVDLRGPSGRLEALLNESAAHPKPLFSALVCHPHPRWGGNMHNKVVYRAMKALNDPAFGLEWPVLRFNFRGTGLSEGAHDDQSESDDVLAAIEWLEAEFRLPVVVAGFSFGAAMALNACCGLHDSNIRAVIALGLPTEASGRIYRYPFLSTCSLPKLFLSGDRDPFAPAEQLRQVAADASEPKRLELLPGADHFFTGHLEAMQHTLARWLKEQLP